MGNKPVRCLRTLKMMRFEHPIVVVMGSTGTGKSKLAIELARRFNGEIISADSMQVYRGLDIITNKVTPDELREVPHHLIDFVDPLHAYTVINFFSDAMPIISRLIQEKRLPIVVGGTHYYIEAILWDMLLLNPEKDAISSSSNAEDQSESMESSPSVAELLKETITPDSFANLSDRALHDCLRDVDPVTASSLHPHNRRKVIRGLQVYQQHGQSLSKILAEQRGREGGSQLGGPLRFPNAILFWIQTDKEVLMKRLDERVDDMLARGLVDELLSFHSEYNARRLQEKGIKYTEGIFQTIGFKEFHEYLTSPKSDEDVIVKRFEQSIESMKLATRKYAKKQIKWINNRFLRRPDREVPPVYGLDSTFPDQWETKVFQPAAHVVEARLQGARPSQQQPLPPLPSLEEEDPGESVFCEACQVLLLGSNTIRAHHRSKKHWRKLKKAKKLAELSRLLDALKGQML